MNRLTLLFYHKPINRHIPERIHAFIGLLGAWLR
jgi:hypothetical protein